MISYNRFLAALVLPAIFLVTMASAYPMITQLSENTEKCYQFNIGQDDDAHMVFLALPSRDDINKEEEIEAWFVDQVVDLSERRSEADNSLPRRFRKQAAEPLLETMEAFLNDASKPMVARGRSGARLKLSFGGRDKSRNISFFQPTVLNFIKRTVASQQRHELDSYEACFDNTNNPSDVQIMWDIILVGDVDLGTDPEAPKLGIRKENLSPLEEALENSIAHANKVIKEMNYLERREARMRKTAESIQARLKNFSYFSIGVLLLVTYVQVTYLKQYFHKLKLL